MSDLRVDQEFDDDDRGDQQRERGADHLLAAALAHERAKIAERGARTDEGRGNQDMDSKIGLAERDRQPLRDV